MDNLFSTNKEIHLRYDLKGSIIGRREINEMDPNNNLKFDQAAYALKDLDLEDQKKYFTIGEKRETIMLQMKNDTEFLRNNNIIDYSLLVGIHFKDIDKNIKSDVLLNSNNINMSPIIEFVQENENTNVINQYVEEFSEHSLLNYDLNYTESVKNLSFEKEKHPFKDVIF